MFTILYQVHAKFTILVLYFTGVQEPIGGWNIKWLTVGETWPGPREGSGKISCIASARMLRRKQFGGLDQQNIYIFLQQVGCPVPRVHHGREIFRSFLQRLYLLQHQETEYVTATPGANKRLA